MKKYTNGFDTHVFFAETIIKIFGGLFLNHLSHFYQVDFKWLKAPRYNLAKKNLVPGGITQKRGDQSGRKLISLQKDTTKGGVFSISQS